MSFFTRMFPQKAKTLQDFIALASREKAQNITVTPLVDSNLSTFLNHEATVNGKRRVVYREVITQRNGGFAVAIAFMLIPGSSRREMIRLCLEGEKRVTMLRQKLSGVTVSLIFEGKVMESFELLHQEARVAGVV